MNDLPALPPQPVVRVGQKDHPQVWFKWADVQAYARAHEAAVIEHCARVVEARAAEYFDANAPRKGLNLRACAAAIRNIKEK